MQGYGAGPPSANRSGVGGGLVSGAVARVERGEIVALLADSELFEGFAVSDLDGLADAAEVRELRRNDPVFVEADSADELFVVRAGRIVISMGSPDGRESVMAL